MLRIVSETTVNGVKDYSYLDVSAGVVAIFCAILAAIYITFYLLRSIGIYKLAKSRGIDKAFLAWIPCVWIYTVCKIIGKTWFFGTPAEKVAVWVAVIFSCTTIIPLVSNFLGYFPFIMFYLEGGTIELVNGGVRAVSTESYAFVNLFDTPAINTIIQILYYFDYILRFAEIFVTVMVYISLFKMFWPEHYILASVLSFLGLFPIFVFAIRNRKAVDFNEYIRNRYYGAGFTPYGNRYYGQNGNNSERGTPYYGNNQGGDNEPFDEFNNRPDEPFGEFSDKKDGDKNDDFFS